LIEATSRILDEDPKNAAAARLKAQACVDAGAYADAVDALLALEDVDYLQPRTLSLFIAAAQHGDLKVFAGGLQRAARYSSASDTAVLRAARGGIRSASTAADHAALAVFADTVLTLVPADVSSARHKAAAATKLSKDILEAVAQGNAAQVEQMLSKYGHLMPLPTHRRATRYLQRRTRRAA
jgi:hypothetical protein